MTDAIAVDFEDNVAATIFVEESRRVDRASLIQPA
jgi:hypothetical protein